jgi:hypothetical protein
MRHTVLGKRVDSGQCGSSLGTSWAVSILEDAFDPDARLDRTWRDGGLPYMGAGTVPTFEFAPRNPNLF